MTGDACADLHLLIQADLDGELAPAEAARVGAHVAGCAACAELQAKLTALSGRVRRDMPYHPASGALRAAVRGRLAGAAGPDGVGSGAPWWRIGLWPAGSFGAGFAVAAVLALTILPPGRPGLPDLLVAGHIRALQPGHLMDVVSTDQHAVKPWFDGRLDFAPPVDDFAAQGFALVGGRLDYLAGRPVAVLVYQHRQHYIDVFVWPESRADVPAESNVNGYNVLGLRRDGMVFWAVSDLNAGELADFARLWRGRTG